MPEALRKLDLREEIVALRADQVRQHIRYLHLGPQHVKFRHRPRFIAVALILQLLIRQPHGLLRHGDKRTIHQRRVKLLPHLGDDPVHHIAEPVIRAVLGKLRDPDRCPHLPSAVKHLPHFQGHVPRFILQTAAGGAVAERLLDLAGKVGGAGGCRTRIGRGGRARRSAARVHHRPRCARRRRAARRITPRRGGAAGRDACPGRIRIAHKAAARLRSAGRVARETCRTHPRSRIAGPAAGRAAALQQPPILLLKVAAQRNLWQSRRPHFDDQPARPSRSPESTSGCPGFDAARCPLRAPASDSREIRGSAHTRKCWWWCSASSTVRVRAVSPAPSWQTSAPEEQTGDCRLEDRLLHFA